MVKQSILIPINLAWQRYLLRYQYEQLEQNCINEGCCILFEIAQKPFDAIQITLFTTSTDRLQRAVDIVKQLFNCYPSCMEENFWLPVNRFFLIVKPYQPIELPSQKISQNLFEKLEFISSVSRVAIKMMKICPEHNNVPQYVIACYIHRVIGQKKWNKFLKWQKLHNQYSHGLKYDLYDAFQCADNISCEFEKIISKNDSFNYLQLLQLVLYNQLNINYKS